MNHHPYGPDHVPPPGSSSAGRGFALAAVGVWLAVAGAVAAVVFLGPAHQVHQWDPFLWRIRGEFGIRWYGLAYLAGLVAGWWVVRRWAALGRLPMPPDAVGDLAVAVGIGMIAGGRLGFVLLYQPSLAWTMVDGFPWWGLLALNHGGMASHGGILGLAAGTAWWCWRRRVPLLPVADAVALVAPIGVVCGRFANFVNGELWGHPSDVPWARIFPAAGDGLPRHPSQLYALGLEGLLVIAATWPWATRFRRPGVATGAVVAVYALGRIIGDIWREADPGQPGGPPLPGHAPIPPILGVFSKGQAYSLVLLVAAVALTVWAWRRAGRIGASAPGSSTP